MKTNKELWKCIKKRQGEYLLVENNNKSIINDNKSIIVL